MKFSQVLAAVLTLVVALWGVAWIVQQSSAKKPERPSQPAPSSSEENHEHEHDHDHAEKKRDYYDSNPFKVDPQATDGPRLEVPEELHLVDRMAKGATGSHEFIIRNVGSVPLKLAKGPTNCKCTVAGLKDQEVPPGGEATIHLEFTPAEVGPFRQGTTIWTNSPAKPEINLVVEADVVNEVISEPPNSWLLGVVPTGQEAIFRGMIYSSLHDEFEITSIETTADDLTVEAYPFTDSEKADHQAKSGYRLVGRLLGRETAGQISEKVVVHTSLEDHPKFEYTVSGNQSGPILIVGPGWYGGRQLVDLGVVQSQQGKMHKLTFMVDPFGEPLEFAQIRANPGFVRVQLEATALSDGSKRDRYTFTLEIPAGSPIGRWQVEQPGELVIDTNHPRQPELKLNLQMDVR